ncbi:MAG TPA: YcxB family protein [Clostridia bacterium]|nr:YcxB family protein [Clostridia bacterium]
MEDSALFTVSTVMEKEDYRAFMNLATFRKSPVIIPLLLLITAAIALIITVVCGAFSLLVFMICWLVELLTILISFYIKIENKIKKIEKTNSGATFGSRQTINFFDEYLVASNEGIEGSNKIKYEQFYQLMESKNYFLLYFNATMGALIRKKDIGPGELDSLREHFRNKFGAKFRKI